MRRGRVSASSIIVIVGIVALLNLSGVSLLADAAATPKATASWTFMVYLDGDNNLEAYGIDDFLEMSSVGSTSQMNILVQFDRSPLTGWSGGTSEYDDWKGTKRFLVEQGDRPTAAYQSSDLGEANMGSGATLQSFLEWGMGNYPATNYALVLWDHGGGWVYGVCSDDTSSGDSLLLPEIRQAISSAESSTGKRVTLVGFDACLMGMTEVAYELRQLTDTVVFSEETEPGQGWAYDKVLSSLRSNPGMSPDQLGEVIVREYSQYYGSSGKETLSSISTAELQQLASSLAAFSSELMSSYGAHSAQVQQARYRSEHFEYDMFVDLYDFADEVKRAAITAPLTNTATQLMLEIDTAVLAEAHGALRPGAHGLAIYFPDVISDLNLVGYREDALLTTDTTWDEFLNVFFNGGGGGASDDYEEDDTYLQASEVWLDQPQYHSIMDAGADVDWVFFQLTSPSDVVVQTSGVSGDTEIYLYEEANVTSSHMAYDDDSGVGYFSRIVAHLPTGKYFVKVNEYGGNSQIDTYQLEVGVPSAGDAYEPDDTPEDASPLAIGESQQHSIGDNGADVDWARFTLDSAQNVLLETWGAEGDTRMWLYVVDGEYLNELDTDDDTGTGLFSMISQSDLPVGDYYVKVEEYYNDNEIGSYLLNLSAYSSDDAYEPDDSHQQSSELVPGQEQWHSIGEEGADVDWYGFYLPSSSSVVIETYGVEGDTEMLLYSSTGAPSSEMASDDDSGEGYFSMLTVGPLASGQYYIKVIAFQGFFLIGAEPIPRYGILLLTSPSAPVGLVAQLQDSQVILDWSAPENDGGSPIDHYEVLRSSIAGQETFYRAVVGQSFLDVNVSAGVDYYYQVRAATSFGKGASSTEAHVLMPGSVVIPSPVNSLQVQEASDRMVLTWSAPADNGSPILLYHILRGLEQDGSDREEIGGTTTTTFTDEWVSEGTTYHYWVVAENANGMGQMPAVTSATAQDPGPDTGSVLLIVLGGVGALVVLGLVLLLLFGRGRKPRPQGPTYGSSHAGAGQGAPVAVQKCPSCGASTQGEQYCGNCGRKLP